ncbi:hypothetical protein D1970_18810 [Mesobacillus zeae]|uniref:Peptidase n=1 Tax=Mesobacillus zeae TaxID=1917180 RepID=A0A398B3D6_9BACI|nr:hypothetical protein D1970_18810 [Mesobacillus zeae]
MAAISMMNEGKCLGEVEAALKEQFPDEDVDILEFVGQLESIGLIASLDGKTVHGIEAVSTDDSGLSWISPRLGRFFFNDLSVKIYSLLLSASFFMFILRPETFPGYKDIFLFDLMMYNFLLWLVVTFLFVCFHELGHVLAARAAGLPAKVEIGHRLFFIVLETDMSRVWSLSPDKRNRLYLAGMYFDGLVLFTAAVSQWLFAGHAFALGLAKIIVFDTLVRLAYQCCVYMKTDLYYVFENMTGCYNLMENGHNYLRRWLSFLPKEKATDSFKGEEKLVRRYAFFYVAGVMVTVLLSAFYYIPQLVFAIGKVIPGFSQPAGSIFFWDSVVFLLQFVLIFALLLYSWSKKYRLQH